MRGRRRAATSAALALIVTIAVATVARAQTCTTNATCPGTGYCTRFACNANGAITFTGNTLGLSKRDDRNEIGLDDAIGAFTTTNTALVVNTFPAGTTLSFALNSSSAVLNLPAGSTVLYAELTWGGSWSYQGSTIPNVPDSLNGPVSFTTPQGTVSVGSDPAFRRTLGTASACNWGTLFPPSVPCFYARTANVTNFVQAAGGGTYTVGGVPGTVVPNENHYNVAGWTLAVAYRNFARPVRNLTLFIGTEVAGNNPASVSGFCTLDSGTVDGRLAVSALEGDASITGDTMRFGPNANLNPNANRLSGPNNPLTNFFASQLNK